MAISERKMKIVIDNYFKDECDVDMSIRQAFEKGFRLGVQKALTAQPEIVRCKDCENWIPGYITDNDDFTPSKCGKYQQMVRHSSDDYCSFAERRTDEAD